MQDPGAAFFPAAAPPFPQLEPHHLRCPRCDSTDTKFCYYNNYNLAQPRHFCRSCRRYWTRGGTLRNVPVGGASRKTAKRPSPSKRSTNPPAAPSSPPAAPPQQIPATHPTPASTGRFGDPLASFHSGEAPPAVDASLPLRGDPATRGGGGGRPDLAMYAPGSEF